MPIIIQGKISKIQILLRTINCVIPQVLIRMPHNKWKKYKIKNFF